MAMTKEKASTIIPRIRGGEEEQKQAENSGKEPRIHCIVQNSVSNDNRYVVTYII